MTARNNQASEQVPDHISRQALSVTPEIVAAMIALEDNADFKYIMSVMDHRVQTLSIWSCMPSSMTASQLDQMRGRVQELVDFAGAFMHRHKWREKHDSVAAEMAKK